MTEQSRTYIK